MSKAYDFLKECGAFFVLTINGEYPAGRPFGAVMEIGDDLYLATNDMNEAHKQMREHKQIQIVAKKPDSRAWIRITGISEECDNLELKARMLETVVLLSKGEVDSKKIRVEFSLEDMDMSEFQDGATYTQIKDYVLEHSGLKVSNLYISQIKRKCGIEVGKNYNLPKSEDSRQPLCPPEKEKAIREAFKYFGII